MNILLNICKVFRIPREAIGRIDTIRDADMKYNDVVGYTYGRLTVLHVLSGNLSVEEEIEYAKPGGVIEYSKSNVCTASKRDSRETCVFIR